MVLPQALLVQERTNAMQLNEQLQSANEREVILAHRVTASSLSASASHFLCTHNHTLITTLHCACCYDVFNGIQDLKIYSHAHSLILSL